VLGFVDKLLQASCSIGVFLRSSDHSTSQAHKPMTFPVDLNTNKKAQWNSNRSKGAAITTSALLLCTCAIGSGTLYVSLTNKNVMLKEFFSGLGSYSIAFGLGLLIVLTIASFIAFLEALQFSKKITITQTRGYTSLAETLGTIGVIAALVTAGKGFIDFEVLDQQKIINQTNVTLNLVLPKISTNYCDTYAKEMESTDVQAICGHIKRHKIDSKYFSYIDVSNDFRYFAISHQDRNAEDAEIALKQLRISLVDQRDFQRWVDSLRQTSPREELILLGLMVFGVAVAVAMKVAKAVLAKDRGC
jgi:hypothetical protein